MLSHLHPFARYAVGLAGFLRRPLTLEQCRLIVAEQNRVREIAFLTVLRRGVFDRGGGPYHALVRAAGIEWGDVEQLVESAGLEGALERLYDAGLYVTHEELKGRRPIRRGSLELHATPEQFDNPLLTRHFEGRTGGSRGGGRRLLIDLDLIAHDAACYAVFLHAFGIADRPFAVWRPTPPDNSGIKRLLVRAKLGHSTERWFSQRPTSWRPATFKYAAMTTFTRIAGPLFGHDMPRPEHAPITQAATVARWLAAKVSEGRPAHLDTLVGCAVRACLAARASGLDISGSFFRVGGEPLTEAKARVITETGCQVAPHYSMAEAGPLAMACADAGTVDDVHVLRSKVALIQRDRSVGHSGITVPAIHITTLLSSSPKLMINVESDDYGVRTTRPCRCAFGELGLHEHLHTIRSYEKLTSDGVTFLGSDLVTLLEDFLPRTFGGHPTDYQLLEEEGESGLPRVSLLVSPRLGPVDEAAVLRAVIERLAARDAGHQLMAMIWRDGETMRVVRQEPIATNAGKILTLHVRRHA